MTKRLKKIYKTFQNKCSNLLYFRCKKICFQRITGHEQLDIFNKFYKFQSKDEQDGYLVGLIEKEDVSRRRPRKIDCDLKKKIDFNYTYHMVATDTGPV